MPLIHDNEIAELDENMSVTTPQAWVNHRNTTDGVQRVGSATSTTGPKPDLSAEPPSRIPELVPR